MPRVNHVLKARKAIRHAGIKVGDSYFWWKFRYGGKHVSKTMPKPSQLTQSEYLSRVYEWQEREQPTFENLESTIEELIGEIEELRDEQDEKFNNMPEGLQQGDTGQLLESRRDSLDNAASDLGSIDVPDEEDLKGELELEDEDEDDADLEAAKQTKAEEIWQEVSEILGNIET